MSELIKHHINEVMDMHCLTKGEMGYSVVYYANDVDKVIAKKDMEIFNLKEELSYIKADSTFDRDKYEELLKSKDAEIAEKDKFIADLEESHKKEVEQLLMKIAGLEKLVETADKLVKQKGGFTVKDIEFNGVKLEGMKND